MMIKHASNNVINSWLISALVVHQPQAIIGQINAPATQQWGKNSMHTIVSAICLMQYYVKHVVFVNMNCWYLTCCIVFKK